MIRTTLKKISKAREERAKISIPCDGIVATIILPPGKEYVMEDIKAAIAKSILAGERPEKEAPQKRDKKEEQFNISFIANSVAEELADCVKEKRLEEPQAMLYLDLIQKMHEINDNIAAFNILISVFRYAGTPIVVRMNDLLDQLNGQSLLSDFFDDFFEHDQIDDFLLELRLIRLGIDPYDDDELLN